MGVSKLSRDVTESRKADAALRDSEARLQGLHTELLHLSRLSAMGQVEAMVAHEVNQPLAAIGNDLNAATILLQREGLARPPGAF